MIAGFLTLVKGHHMQNLEVRETFATFTEKQQEEGSVLFGYLMSNVMYQID